MTKLVRANLILLGVLLGQAIVLFALPKDGAVAAGTKNDDAGVAGREPFSSVEAKAARAVTITAGDGKVVRLEATTKKEGEKDVTTWTLASRDHFPARSADVEKILEAAKRVRLSRVITRQPKRYAKLNVADGVMHARVQVAGDGGKSLADFRLGESNFNTINVRMEGDPAVYEAAGVSTWEFPTTVSGLVDTGFIDLPSDQVVRVKLTSGTEMFEIAKETPESRPTSAPASRGAETGPSTRAAETKPEPKWVVASNHEVLDKSKVESWIRGLTRINLSDPIGKERKPEFGFEKPTATATLTMADGKETTITVGAERKDEHDSYLAATGKDFIVTVASFNVTDHFQKKLKDLMPGSTPPGAEEPHNHEHR